jgi:hypothetical protein
VLAVAIHADDVLKSQREGQFVARLHAAAEAQMMRQRQNFGARRARHGDGVVERAIVDHQHRDSGNTVD